ncbi:transcriptional regulator [Streptomyces sulfonofaciens]|uniref:Transcriptional regulator n=1 Tax=Streptomyces sulfonofaciens TaxID=68272 RepID=A0A919L1Z1_9ACTN|nr:LCP family protein [Streptomyces sulfonofaciens]GHH79841.1 transcriptional regulator [Streptomyces sulfonofaciens]
MRQSGVRGEGVPIGARGPDVRSAHELGWDDSLYQEGSGAAGEAVAVAAGGRGGRHGPPGGREAAGAERRSDAGAPRRGRRVLRWSATVLSVLILGTAGAGYLYYQHLNGNIRTDPLNIGDHKAPAPTPNAAGQTPLNILLIGSDARDTKENQKLGGARSTFGGAPRADVQMLVHLSADRSNMSVVSMPRDTLVQIPQCTDPKTGRVYPASTERTLANQSLERGGPGCTVATWEQLTGIHIDHFMMVDFAGVVSMADAIGGVPVCVDANIHSKDSQGHGSGLKLTKGTHYIKGEQALQWLRTRYGFEDGSDIARTKAQHQYMNSMVRELRKNATLSNPGKLRGIAEEATKALRVDNGLDTVKKLYDLSTELKKVPADRITSTTMPYDYVGARVVPKPGDADQLFRLVRDDLALDGKKTGGKKPAPPPAASEDEAAPDGEIAVRVQNGTRTPTLAPVSGRASEVAQQLGREGFTRAVADPTTPLAQERTVLRYPSADLEGDAQRVAKALGIPPSAVERSTNVTGVTLVVGADWRLAGPYPKSAGTGDDKAPKSADPLNGADASACMHVNPAYSW